MLRSIGNCRCGASLEYSDQQRYEPEEIYYMECPDCEEKVCEDCMTMCSYCNEDVCIRCIGEHEEYCEELYWESVYKEA